MSYKNNLIVGGVKKFENVELSFELLTSTEFFLQKMNTLSHQPPRTLMYNQKFNLKQVLYLTHRMMF